MKKKTGKGLADSVLLVLILCGWIKLVDGKLMKYHVRRRRFEEVQPTLHPKGGRYRYNIRMGHNQRTIQRNRLHWMITHKALIPAGADVDHKDHDKTNDDPKNLTIRGYPENRSDNWSFQNFQNVADFFDNIGKGTF